MITTDTQAPPWAPGIWWWLLLAALLGIGLFLNLGLALGLLFLLLIQLWRPFDFMTAYLLVVGGAALVSNAAGGLTYQLGLLTVTILLMLMCYVLVSADRVFSLPRTSLTWPLGLFAMLSLANAARGFVAGYSRRNWGLDLIPLLALASAFLVANVFERRRDLKLSVIGLIVVGYAASAGGIFAYVTTKMTHEGAAYALAVPGIIGLLLVNLALRADSTAGMLGWIVLSLPLFLHQFLAFGRGLWTGGAAGLLLSLALFGRRGHGAAGRWKRAGLVLATFAGFGVMGAIQLAFVVGDPHIFQQAATRVASIGGTQIQYETRSNLIRLGEYLVAIKHIRESPWIGHGVGYTYLVKQAFSHEAHEQWWVHENFLFVWLKQGLIGLALFLWMLISATTLGIREARRRTDTWESTWFATTSAATVFLAVFSLSNFPFALVNETFLVAILWGASMAMTRKGFITLHWSAPDGTTPREAR